ncbi:DUF3710 domain-containing protein [Nocardioides mesophilus]|uniref:DUF3710 domain-containing protein n=1 Tax=Nocardioides mesophilus TaxID=433659 RepID=A0A7G9RBK7_9ACTN|nr:DUF3710 domain-containing protein [Nocardioides mesophilus]QNN52982.1 DUF3710 domain-containing protein [Nocardioides mesophilus]
MKFRRKGSEETEATEQAGAESAEGVGDAAAAPRAQGPWDVSERDVPDEPNVVDLGSLVLRLQEGLELQLQVDERSEQVVAAVLAHEEGALELRAFAAPRHGDIWDDVRREIAAEVTRRGGTATEAEGPWGTELRVVLNVSTPDGRTGSQPSRVFGIAGPRWLLRATLFGKPALDPDDDGLIETALRDVVVRRGTAPHAPGEPLPLTVPGGLVQPPTEV